MIISRRFAAVRDPFMGERTSNGKLHCAPIIIKHYVNDKFENSS